ncbi:glycosyltransferase [Chryseobacterium aahli]|uniref:glycosyltransferase family 2 protein n=1 Tax=Chryseobacterium aahli TaxID=1278643 RepID=UPI001F61FD57|nr:glycosyltransferase [Chryseobacterium aahli]MCI3936495.1 glycosyltransferase [Chryseobacterium aahli]
MKLSIIVPVYNLENYISRCLDSILIQDFPDYEIIIINDGSTDRSLSICEHYALADSRIKVFSQKNSGVSNARNMGIENSCGEWICFIDGDDFINKQSLNKIFSSRDMSNYECVVARSHINDGVGIIKEKYEYNESFVDETFDGVRLAVDRGYFRGSIWGAFYKRQFLINNNIVFPPNIKNGEDAIFFSMVLIFAKKITFSDINFYNVYERQGSASRSWTFDRVIYMVNNIKFINSYITSNPHLSVGAINILHYNIYRTISVIYNSFSRCFSFKNFFILNSKLKKELTFKINVGEIFLSSSKINLLNISLNLFALSILIKNKINKKI